MYVLKGQEMKLNRQKELHDAVTAKYLTRHYSSFYANTLKIQCSRNFNDFHTETKDLDTLSEWVKSISCILKSRIKRLRGQMKTIYPSF